LRVDACLGTLAAAYTQRFHRARLGRHKLLDAALFAIACSRATPGCGRTLPGTTAVAAIAAVSTIAAIATIATIATASNGSAVTAFAAVCTITTAVAFVASGTTRAATPRGAAARRTAARRTAAARAARCTTRGRAEVGHLRGLRERRLEPSRPH
jgi:hypothetical protein